MLDVPQPHGMALLFSIDLQRNVQGRVPFSVFDLTFRHDIFGLHPDKNVSLLSLALNKTSCLTFPWLLSILRHLREAMVLEIRVQVSS